MPRAFIGAALAFVAGGVFAQDLPKSEIPFERYYSYPLLNGRSPAAPRMSHGGKAIVFGWNNTGERKLDLWTMDYPSGEKRRIVKADDIAELPRQDDTRTQLEKDESKLYDGGIGGAQWSPDDKELMFSYKGRTWLVNPDGSNLHPILDGSAAMSGLEYAKDGSAFYYTNGQNIYRMSRTTGAVKQLTFLSKPQTSISQWDVSPDGKTIAVVWSDDSKGGRHVMMDFSKDRATIVNISRMWNGDVSVDNQIGIVPAEGGVVKFVSNLPRYLWVKDFKWTPDGRYVALAWIKDDDTEFTVSMVNPKTVQKFDAYTEKAPETTINDWRSIEFTRDAKRMYVATDIVDGKPAFRSIVSMDLYGRDIRKVYSENHDVGGFMRPEKSDRLVLAVAAKSPLTTQIVTLDPDGKREMFDVMPGGWATPKGFNWSDMPLVSDDGKAIATLASNRRTNTELYSVTPLVKRLTVSQRPEFAKIKWAKTEEVTFPGPDGVPIHGILTYDPNLDRSQRHPAVVSGIYADSGKAAWAGYVENYLAMECGFVCLTVDFRSSWGYGETFNQGYNKKLGLIDADEAVKAKEFLAAMPFVRGDRVGIWGWSYGGYLTCMTLLTKPGVFDTGVAVASVTDWKTYNEWYTRRRLGLVKDDKDKLFEKTSPITYASGLKDNLLLVHGMLDDNVLFQDTARLMQRLIDNGKHFDVMAYPRDDHSIGKDTSRPHVYGTIVRYLYQKLSRP